MSTVPLRSVSKVLVSNVDKKSVEGELSVRLCNYTDVYYERRLHLGLDYRAATATPEQRRTFGLRVGDTVITKDSETADDIGVAALVTEAAADLVCGYHLAILRPGPTLDPSYLYWQVASRFVQEQLSTRASGVTRYGLTYDAIRGVRLMVPAMAEQRRIANFLDDQVGRLDEAMQEATRLRGLLIEHWEAWVDQALARHTEHVLLASLTDPARPIQYGIVLPGPHAEGGIPIVKGGDVAAKRLKPELLSRTAPEIEARYPRSRLVAGDLLIAIRGSVGEVARVPAELARANITQDAARIAAARCDATWLRWVLQTPTVQSAIAARVTGATVRGINIGELRRVPIPAVDSHEQRRLGQLAEGRAEKHQAALVELSASVRLLEERKRALITACVTGEFDVSAASDRAGDVALAHLPPAHGVLAE